MEKLGFVINVFIVDLNIVEELVCKEGVYLFRFFYDLWIFYKKI